MLPTSLAFLVCFPCWPNVSFSPLRKWTSAKNNHPQCLAQLLLWWLLKIWPGCKSLPKNIPYATRFTQSGSCMDIHNSTHVDTNPGTDNHLRPQQRHRKSLLCNNNHYKQNLARPPPLHPRSARSPPGPRRRPRRAALPRGRRRHPPGRCRLLPTRPGAAHAPAAGALHKYCGPDRRIHACVQRAGAVATGQEVSLDGDSDGYGEAAVDTGGVQVDLGGGY